MKKFFVIAFLLILSYSKSDNKYGLKTVDSEAEYLQQVEADSDMQMVNLEKHIPNIVLDIRYATKNNFTGEVIYSEPLAFARKPIADALKKAQDSLNIIGFGLKIFDAYRPYSATVKFYEVYEDTNFVANPRYGSRHNRGAAVDVSLVNIQTGQELEMPTPFDDFTEKANPDYMDLPKDALKNRELLIGIMAHFGFSVYPTEWWHFDYAGWDKYPLMNLEFDVFK